MNERKLLNECDSNIPMDSFEGDSTWIYIEPKIQRMNNAHDVPIRWHHLIPRIKSTTTGHDVGSQDQERENNPS